ncbi:hypothetical protein FAF40_07585 [Staphylococcus haemolyticus]|nr:hypothetical protein FAF40_07585 [Staphylococcus haemolyticus]
MFNHKNLDYKSNKSNNNHKNISNSETTRLNNVQSNSHIKKDNVPHDTEINNSKKVKQTNPITNSKTNTSNKNKIKLVKSRLLCKMLYNVFTISTYQN